MSILHTYIHVCMYGCICAFAISMLLCVLVMVMSSAYVISFVSFEGGDGISAVYMLKSVGERTPP